MTIVLVEWLLAYCGQDASGPLHAKILGDLILAYAEAHDLTRMYPGSREALQILAAEGHRLAICTNKPQRPALAILKHLGLDNLFQAVIGGDSLPQRKPDPAPLHATIAALGSGKSIFVGDSEVDTETAHAASIPFALFTAGYRNAPIEDFGAWLAFDSHAALPGLIRQLAPHL